MDLIPTLEEKLHALKVVPATEHELACVKRVAAGDYEIAVQRTNDILEEAHEVFVRSSRSSMGVAGDSIVAIFSARGDLVNASSGTYLHSVIPPLVIKYIIKRFSANPGIRDGDIWFANDALFGGIHNPDQAVVMPVFVDGEMVAWAGALSHTTETGACEPGGMPVSAKSRFEEGMNLPPIKIGENFEIREDFLGLFAAFGLRAEQMVTVDLRARATAADRLRTRLVEMCAREGVEFVTGMFRRMLMDAEGGARRRISSWPDGAYRCVNFSDAVGSQQGLVRTCYMTMIKRGGRLVFDFTGTGPESMSSSNAHAQASIGHLVNFIYEYVFHDLPISNATFQPVDFIFPPSICLNASERAATSCSVMVCTGLMSAIHNCVARAEFATQDWGQATASNANRGSTNVLAGISQWKIPFADLIAYALNAEGQGARARMDGMDAFGFSWCSFGRAPDVETMENEFPLLLPISQHWPDSGGAGKFRGGVGTAQLWVVHHMPEAYYNSCTPGSNLVTPQPLFGGYAPPTSPGIMLRNANVPEILRHDGNLTLDLLELLAGNFGGELSSEFHARPTRRFERGQVITVVLSGGAAGYGDPLEREPKAVARDLVNKLISERAAANIYRVAWDAQRRAIDPEQTALLRAEERRARIARGRPVREFEREWLRRKPPEEILEFYGSWPDAAASGPLFRP